MLIIIQVSLSYTVTAGLALFIVLFYYVSAYCPDEWFPGGPEGQTRKLSWRKNFKINPVDIYFLEWRLRRSSRDAFYDRDELSRKDRIRNGLTHV